MATSTSAVQAVQVAPSIALLLDRVSEYERQGRLTAKQSRDYQRLLRRNPETAHFVAQELRRMPTTEVDAAPPAAAATTSQNSNHAQPPPQEKQQPTSSEQQQQEPSILWNDPPAIQQHISSDTALQELFVEMCFFARLGLVQPPCCLPCAYAEAREPHAQNNDCCNNWVIWRRDANLPLHPETLGDNLVFVRCHAVRRLLSAASASDDPPQPLVEGCFFDARQRRLLKKE